MKTLVTHLHVGRFDRKHRIHFGVNVSIGIVIAIIFFVMGNTNWGEQITNQGFDVLVSLENRIFTQKSAPVETPVYAIEITHDDYRAWKRPDATPRGKLAVLIEDAWKQGAAVIVMDILMPCPNRDDLDGDSKLRSVLTRMVRENAKTHVILPVTVSQDGTLGSHYLDDLLDNASGKRILHRGYPAIEATASDRLNRYWTPYQPYFDKQGLPRILWSVPMLASSIRGGMLSKMEQLTASFEQQATTSSSTGKQEQAEQTIMLSGKEVGIPAFNVIQQAGGGRTLVRKEAHLNLYTQRIRFRLAPETPSMIRSRITADKFTTNGDTPLPDLHNKIVLIGNTSPDLGDYHWTPVGKIAGMYILLNAINTLSAGLQPVHMNVFVHILIELFVIIVAAYLFLYFESFTAQLLASVFFVALFFPISWFIYYKWGLFFNFVIPVVGMSFHKMAASIEKRLNNYCAKHKDADAND